MKKHPTRHPRAPHALGIDIGRVLISAGEGPGDTSFLGSTEDASMATPPMPGAFAAVAALVEAFEGRVHLVSKCGTNVERRSLRWLARHRFHEETGLLARHVHFCRERREKAGIALRLGLDAFVDDRVDVLLPMAGTVALRVLFGPQTRLAPPGLVHAVDWAAATPHLLAFAAEPVRARGA